MNIYDNGLIMLQEPAIPFTVIAVPLALRKVPRNVVYGCRTRANMGHDEVRYAANVHFGR